jgi:hypothetical protein
LLQFTLGGLLPFPQNVKPTALRSLEERFTHVRFTTVRFI